MSLPKFGTDDEVLMQLQTTWTAQLDPLLRAALSNGQVLQSVSLATGSNQVNHKLGRKLQGWFITRLRAAAQVYDTQDANPFPNLTLSLVASAPAVVDIYVF